MLVFFFFKWLRGERVVVKEEEGEDEVKVRISIETQGKVQAAGRDR